MHLWSCWLFYCSAIVQPQVLLKRIPFSIVVSVPVMHDLWVADSLERQAAYMLGCGVSAQIETLTGAGLNQFMLPVWAKIGALLPQECRLRLPSGEHAIYNKATHDVHLQLPKVSLDYK